MIKRCNPQKVEEIYLQVRSWRKTARALNDLYGVSLSHTAWRDYAKGEHDIADLETRALLMLPPRACPACGRKHETRKPTKLKRIRKYGYPIEKTKTLVETLDLRHAPR